MASLRHRLTSPGPDTLRPRFTGDHGLPKPGSGSDTLFRARYGCYLVLGFDPEQAFFLAMTPEIGIIDALSLVESNCPHETAVAILV